LIVYLQHKTDMFQNPGIFSHVIPEHRPSIIILMNMFCSIHGLRLLYSKQCFIGFVGPQNAGKSTLLNKLFDKTADVGMSKHTVEPTIYGISKNIFVIDFPGSDSLEDQSQRFKEFGFMNNFFVYVIPFNGTPSQSIVANVKAAYRMEYFSGKSAKTIFCINQSSKNRGEVVLNDNYKEKYVEKIKEGIQNTDYEEEYKEIFDKLKNEKTNRQWIDEIKETNEKLKKYALDVITTNDFLFTDWLNPDPNVGIEGPIEVGKRIRQYLLDSQIRKPTDMNDIDSILKQIVI